MSLRLPLRDARRLMSDQDRYDAVAQAAAGQVISGYSTSFGLACRLLDKAVRGHVRNVYALVRLADEVVDGPLGAQAPERAGDLLDRLEQEVTDALRDGHSANLVVHAFALTARSCGIGTDLVTPFFSSMRADLVVRDHDVASLERYVYGSAEVVGLMCLKVFLANATAGRLPSGDTAGYADLAPGARRLGAAFQKVNFLRDLTADHQRLGRCYLPGVDPARLTETDKHRLLDDVDADLAAAAPAMRLLPPSSRRAVAVAHGLFAELEHRLRAAPAEQVMAERVRVPGGVKARVVLAPLLRESRP
jgi:phytoene/squalene synthetase